MSVVAGCKPQSQITQYTIPKPESIQLPPPANLPKAADSASSAAGRPERMLGAIVPHGQQFWFFKLTGPPEPVDARTDEFRAFLMSLRFGDKDEPTWTLPEGWSQEPGSGMRFSTITVGKEPPLELSVIALPNIGGDLAPQILANVNRWRGQLSLPPIDLEQLGKDTESLTTPDGLSITVVDYSGTTSGGGMMNAPFAGGMGLPGMGRGADLPQVESNAAAAVKYEAPKGWTQGKVGGMRKAALNVFEGEQKAEITVIDLPAEAGGDRLANVNRWRGQVGLPPVSAEELQAAMQKISVGSLEGDYVELAGSPDAEKSQTILGVMVDRGGKTWFLKLQGDTALALSQKGNFEAFVKSVRFE